MLRVTEPLRGEAEGRITSGMAIRLNQATDFPKGDLRIIKRRKPRWTLPASPETFTTAE